MPPELPALVVFGPQATVPASSYLTKLRSVLINDHELQHFARAIAELADIWPILLDAQPGLHQLPGLEMLQAFRRWVTEDAFEFEILDAFPNTQLAVLTVIIHVIEYVTFLDSLDSPAAQKDVLSSVRDGGIQGLCTGMIAAVALACSANKEEICKNAATAIRLAVCIGAWIDMDRGRSEDPEKTCCLSTSWTSHLAARKLGTVLEKYSQAYISVSTDTTSATITAPQRDIPALSRELTENGMRVYRLEVNGRFHHPTNEEACWELRKLCASAPLLHYHPDNRPTVPVRRNDNSQIIHNEVLHDVIIQCIVKEKAEWHSTMLASVASIGSSAKGPVLVLGPFNCIPHSLMATYNLRILHSRPQVGHGDRNAYHYPENSIAVVGAACRFPGADSLDQFWEIIRSGRSMVTDLPENRFENRESKKPPCTEAPSHGNFIEDAGAFDHRFFGKSTREARFMDPQQRISLQVAYEAVESAGLLSHASMTKDVGCYVGVAASDYETNVNSHTSTAFSFTGTARSFISGSISHFFGWTGPSIVIDTACSSSTVAIHTACKAIQSGECTMALAGGVNIITSPRFHQHLAAATFLSRTEACRAFDSEADGYCRGEGCGFVLLKKLSFAIADGDNILGVVVGSAVNQNERRFPPTVPVSESQVGVYERALTNAGIHPSAVSYVEAHGTGTPRGDPIECQSIRQIFGGYTTRTLYFGSVKGNIGHSEAASGVAGFIKVLLMMQHRQIPPQANFKRVNPVIPRLEPENMAITTMIKDWDSKFQVACVNNYGASGSNATLLVCQPPQITKSAAVVRASRYPFLITGHCQTSIQRYCTALSQFIESNSPRFAEEQLLQGVSFNLSRTQNQRLQHKWAFTAQSISQLKEDLTKFASQPAISQSLGPLQGKPVVLVFAGQTGNTVRFSEDAYRSSYLLQSHLNSCDQIVKSLGLNSLFPRLFNQEEASDLVDLHCMLFSLQYSCARSWIDSGLKVDMLVGHSFGQFTVLCISGSITLLDAMKLVSTRASLIQSMCSRERGRMLSVDGDLETTETLAQSIPNTNVEIACHNASSSFTLSGTAAAIDAIENAVISGSFTRPVRVRPLDVTHGFHSEVMDSVVEEYLNVTESVTYRPTSIPIETCSKDASWAKITAQLVAQMSRAPVYFSDAIARIEQRLGSCVWIEAGSGSAGVTMARRALNTADYSSHSFHSVKLAGPDPIGSLADTTVRLWNDGVQVQFWLYHSLQRSDFIPLRLPAYQFEKSRHWLSHLDQYSQVQSTKETTPRSVKPPLVSLNRYLQGDQHVTEFVVNQLSDEYGAVVGERSIFGRTLCPASLYAEIASRSADLVLKSCSSLAYVFCIENLELLAPLGFSLNRTIRLTLIHQSQLVWEFTVSSCGHNEEPSCSEQHAGGTIRMQDAGSPKLASQRLRFQRLIDYERLEDLMDDPAASTIQGPSVYNALDNVIKYPNIFRGVKSITFKGMEALGYVTRSPISAMHTTGENGNLLVLDSFLQCAEIHVNIMGSGAGNEVFVPVALDEVLEYTKAGGARSASGPWAVYSRLSRVGENNPMLDIFVFNPMNRTLVFTIFGIQFSRISAASLQRPVNSVNGNVPSTKACKQLKAIEFQQPVPRVIFPTGKKTNGIIDSKLSRIQSTAEKLVREITGAEPGSISASTSLRELGIDSLSFIELRTAIKEVFQLDLYIRPYTEDMDFGTLCREIGSQVDSRLPPDPDPCFPQTNGCYDSPGLHTTSRNKHVTSARLGNDEIRLRLTGLVAEHVNIPDEILPDTPLCRLGLDSLTAIGLESDIKRTFGVTVRLMELDPNCTFGDLSTIIAAPQCPSIVDNEKAAMNGC